MRRLLLALFGSILLCGGLAQAQSTGTLMPWVPQQFEDANGSPCASCLLTFYSAGTSTKLNTYADSALSVPNTNPIVLNAAGRNPAGGIYLSAASYKVVLTTASGSTVWTLDNVGAIPYTTIASSFNAICDGRLTLTTATPVTSADVLAATVVRWTPYQGNRCALYDGAQWNLASFTEVSLSLGTDAADTNYDVFLYLSSGSPTLERVAWTNATTRATALVFQDGVYVKSSDTKRRYLGTYRTTATIGQTEDSLAKRFVWNYLHRVPRPVRVTESTDSWTYTTAVFRQANGAAANQVAVVIGVAEVAIDLRVFGVATNGGSTAVIVGIGEDSTSSPVTGSVVQPSNAAAEYGLPSASLIKYPAVGYHVYVWLEFSVASGTTTWYGDSGSPNSLQTGMIGTIGG